MQPTWYCGRVSPQETPTTPPKHPTMLAVQTADELLCLPERDIACISPTYPDTGSDRQFCFRKLGFEDSHQAERDLGARRPEVLLLIEKKEVP